MFLRPLIVAPVVVALLACEAEPLPEKPQLIVNRESIGFGAEFGDATYVGTKPQESLQIENGGLNLLVLQQPQLVGDAAFTLEGPETLEIKGKKSTFLRIVFAPTQAKDYKATLVILSNAENAPFKEIPITGRGIQPLGDGGA